MHFIAARHGCHLTHHLDVDDEAATLAAHRILEGPANRVRTQREFGLDGHVQRVGLLDAIAYGAGRCFARITIHGDQWQLDRFALHPAQRSHQCVRIEFRREIETHLRRTTSANVAGGTLRCLRARIHAHLVDAAHIGAIRTGLIVDHLRVGARGGQQQREQAQRQHSRKMQHGASNGKRRMRCADDLP